MKIEWEKEAVTINPKSGAADGCGEDRRNVGGARFQDALRRLPRALLIAEGRKLFEEYQCQGCHTLDGVGGEIGPRLDGAGARLRPDFMYRWVLDPQRIVPGTPMPNKDLWEEEAQALVCFLRTLKKTRLE